MPSKEENARNGLPETDWRDAQYDMLYLPVTETVRYHYDFNGNRIAAVLPDGRQINYLYYGSGHLHQISLDDEVITDIERDKLHREIYRTQGKLASRYELDPLGRLKRQIATLNDLTEGGKGKTKVAAGYGQTAVKRSYGYDRTGNLTHSTDQRTGTTKFEYDKLGRITQAGTNCSPSTPRTISSTSRRKRSNHTLLPLLWERVGERAKRLCRFQTTVPSSPTTA